MAKNAKEKSKVNRRGFLGTILMVVGLVATYGTGAVYALKFLSPKKRKNRYRKILVTSRSELAKNGNKTFKDLTGQELILVDTGKDLQAISTKCTHLGCKVHWSKQENNLFCPCHDATFDLDGNVLSGPPPRPLDRYEVEVDRNDNVFVLVKEV